MKLFGFSARLEGSTPISDEHPPGVGRAIAAFGSGLGQSENGEFRALAYSAGAGRIDEVEQGFDAFIVGHQTL